MRTSGCVGPVAWLISWAIAQAIVVSVFSERYSLCHSKPTGSAATRAASLRAPTAGLRMSACFAPHALACSCHSCGYRASHSRKSSERQLWGDPDVIGIGREPRCLRQTTLPASSWSSRAATTAGSQNKGSVPVLNACTQAWLYRASASWASVRAASGRASAASRTTSSGAVKSCVQPTRSPPALPWRPSARH